MAKFTSDADGVIHYVLICFNIFKYYYSIWWYKINSNWDLFSFTIGQNLIWFDSLYICQIMSLIIPNFHNCFAIFTKWLYDVSFKNSFSYENSIVINNTLHIPCNIGQILTVPRSWNRTYINKYQVIKHKK